MPPVYIDAQAMVYGRIGEMLEHHFGDVGIRLIDYVAACRIIPNDDAAPCDDDYFPGSTVPGGVCIGDVTMVMTDLDAVNYQLNAMTVDGLATWDSCTSRPHCFAAVETDYFPF